MEKDPSLFNVKESLLVRFFLTGSFLIFDLMMAKMSCQRLNSSEINIARLISFVSKVMNFNIHNERTNKQSSPKTIWRFSVTKF
uniref:Uncharacterized protein n=1 Tax=Onchocerca volvulus TaxID=6282 RepID=A0A8R1Y8A3_ONCVO